MAKKDIKFTLDTIDSRYSPVGTVKQLDSVFFHIKITENGVTKDLTGQTIKLFAIKEDKKIVEQTTKINITNQREGLVEIELLNAAIQVHGFTYFELEISDSNGIISTADFILRVNKRVGSPEAIESTNEVSTLKKVDAYVAKAKVELEEFKKIQSEILSTNGKINTQESLRIAAETKRKQAEETRVEADNLRNEKIIEFGLQVAKNTSSISLINIPYAVNTVKNGAFKNGVEEWNSMENYGRPSSLSILHNNLQVKATTLSQAGVKGNDCFSLNKKYYVRTRIRALSSDCLIILVKQGDLKEIAKIENPKVNTWYEIDNVIKIENDIHKFISVFAAYSTPEIAKDKIFEIDYCLALEIDNVNLSENITLEELRKEIKIEENWDGDYISFFDCKEIKLEIDELRKKNEASGNETSNKDSLVVIEGVKDIFLDKKIFLNTYLNPETGVQNESETFSTSDFIEVEPKTEYIFDRNDYKYNQSGSVTYFDSSKNKIGGEYKYEKLTTPAGCKYIRISVYNANEFNNLKLLKGNKLKPVSISRTPTIFENKKWTVIGDSWTEKNYRTSLNYHDYIANELGFNVVNLGIGGTGYKNRDSEASNDKAFYQRIDQIPVDTDIVTILGGVNDCLFQSNTPIGEITDNTNSTLCGCVNLTIDRIYKRLPCARLGVITPGASSHFNPIVSNNKMQLFTDKIIEICRSRGIPYLDLYRSSGLRPWVAEVNKEMFSCGDSPNGDGLHPNSKGHYILARKIKEFVKTL